MQRNPCIRNVRVTRILMERTQHPNATIRDNKLERSPRYRIGDHACFGRAAMFVDIVLKFHHRPHQRGDEVWI
ncbi:hypothetical protein RLDS_05720 [Sphingobium lactosutens DS20]|uniref:Uncharacterized protein n=1 Tax=Sphingobium lactosutens DS20 TaxID=1331060 RepID=T0HUY7_9SPHN|nr:hypothetical protein RLDS_05720 [Sphingobium lactosutens DS20]